MNIEDVKLPEVLPKLKLVGNDGNVFSILGNAQHQSRKVYTEEEWTTIRKEATSEDYDHVLQTLMTFFDVS